MWQGASPELAPVPLRREETRVAPPSLESYGGQVFFDNLIVSSAFARSATADETADKKAKAGRQSSVSDAGQGLRCAQMVVFRGRTTPIRIRQIRCKMFQRKMRGSALARIRPLKSALARLAVGPGVTWVRIEEDAG